MKMKTYRAKVFFEGYRYVQFEARSEKEARKLLEEDKIDEDDFVESSDWVTDFGDLCEVDE